MLIDIHSHLREVPLPVFRVLNVRLSKQPLFPTEEVQGSIIGLSAGIHPWDAEEWSVEDVEQLEPLFLLPKVLLIGEIGVDKVYRNSLDHQLELFNAQAALADKLKKPVLLHMVRSLAEVMAVKKKYAHVPAWIIHGFRGGREEAEQCCSNGFYLSFGSAFNLEGLRACPVERLFAETDETGQLPAVYAAIASGKRIQPEQLERLLYQNFCRLFPWLDAERDCQKEPSIPEFL